MSSLFYRTTTAVAAFMAMTASVPFAQAQDAGRTLADNEAIFIDGKTLTVTPGRSKGDLAPQLRGMNVHALGPGAIVFRSGDRLYAVEGMPMGRTMAMYDPGNDRQRSYGGLYDPYPASNQNDRQRSYGGLYDPYPSSDQNDRQRSYGGLSDPYPGSDRQRSYGGLYDPYPASDQNDRQRSYGGLYDPYPASNQNDRQRSYGGFYDSGAESRRQQSYGGLNDDRQRSYGGFYDSGAEWRRQQSYGGLHDPDYANYRLKRAFGDVFGANSKN